MGTAGFRNIHHDFPIISYAAPSICICLVAGELVRSNDPRSYAGGAQGLAASSKRDRSLGEGPDKRVRTDKSWQRGMGGKEGKEDILFIYGFVFNVVSR